MLSVLLAGVAFGVGWQLPLVCDTGGGDACVVEPAVDWDRVDWSIPPSRIACGEPHPGPGDGLIGPGDVCVTSVGGSQTEVGYEALRTAGAVRRVGTLVVVAVLLVGGVVAAVRPGRARRRT